MHKHAQIRSATTEDETAVADLGLINEMFAVDEIDGLIDAFRGALAGDLEGHQWFVSADENQRVVAAAYVAPEPFADRLWNLYFIAVHPPAHGTGIGTALVEHVTTFLRDQGESRARILLVETSSTDRYAATRAFYDARGFDREAQIRDFYGPGDHKVVFWKSLSDT